MQISAELQPATQVRDEFAFHTQAEKGPAETLPLLNRLNNVQDELKRPIAACSVGSFRRRHEARTSNQFLESSHFSWNLRKERNEAAKGLVWSALIACVSMIIAAASNLVSPSCAFFYVLGAWVANAIAMQRVLTLGDFRPSRQRGS